jgi:hypothetical protein
MSQSLFPSFDHQNKDPSARKHGGNEQSQEAFDRIKDNLGGDCLTVYHFIISQGDLGATPKEIAAHMGKPLHSISGRVTTLKLATLVHPNGLKRDGSAAVVANRK